MEHVYDEQTPQPPGSPASTGAQSASTASTSSQGVMSAPNLTIHDEDSGSVGSDSVYKNKNGDDKHGGGGGGGGGEVRRNTRSRTVANPSTVAAAAAAGAGTEVNFGLPFASSSGRQITPGLLMRPRKDKKMAGSKGKGSMVYEHELESIHFTCLSNNRPRELEVIIPVDAKIALASQKHFMKPLHGSTNMGNGVGATSGHSTQNNNGGSYGSGSGSGNDSGSGNGSGSANANGSDSGKGSGTHAFTKSVHHTRRHSLTFFGQQSRTSNVVPLTLSKHGNRLDDLYNRGDFSQLCRLSNKKPQWNEAKGEYQLNFHGRVKEPSVNNFITSIPKIILIINIIVSIIIIVTIVIIKWNSYEGDRNSRK